MSSDVQADAFGMREGIERDTAQQQEQPVQQQPEELVPSAMNPERAADLRPAKAAPYGIPIGAWIGIGVLILVMVIGIVSLITAKVSSSTRADALKMVSADRDAAETAAVAGVRQDVATQQETIRQLQQQLGALREQASKGAAGQDLSAFDQRIARVELGLKDISRDVSVMAKRYAEGRPFEAELYIRDDLEIVSIGGGLATVKDRAGREFVLRRGDRWGALRVQSIRADRWQVTFSDGSVLL